MTGFFPQFLPTANTGPLPRLPLAANGLTHLDYQIHSHHEVILQTTERLRRLTDVALPLAVKTGKNAQTRHTKAIVVLGSLLPALWTAALIATIMLHLSPIGILITTGVLGVIGGITHLSTREAVLRAGLKIENLQMKVSSEQEDLEKEGKGLKALYRRQHEAQLLEQEKTYRAALVEINKKIKVIPAPENIPAELLEAKAYYQSKIGEIIDKLQAIN